MSPENSEMKIFGRFFNILLPFSLDFPSFSCTIFQIFDILYLRFGDY